MEKCTSREQKHIGDVIGDANESRYTLDVRMYMQGRIGNVNETLLMQKRTSCE